MPETHTLQLLDVRVLALGFYFDSKVVRPDTNAAALLSKHIKEAKKN